MSKPYQVLGDLSSPGPFLFTCEHASNRVPDPYPISVSDRPLLEDHWGWDIGAAHLVRALVSELGGQAVLSDFSRLLVDPNRPVEADSLIVREIDGQVIDLNRNVDTDERDRRIGDFFEAYHGEVDRVGRARAELGRAFHVVSIHSFTPVYLGHVRAMEIGVLFDDFDEDAWHLQQALLQEEFVAELNEPYSGRGPGALIYSAQRHGHALGTKYLELEVRQDLIAAEGDARAVAARVGRALKDAFLPEGCGG
ncbi:MAG: N-formylglutamate amidohydrolase [Deltaproteobacteria bacterium]|nr:N-formylglutamate amidohydrolase [Deltaproteobacteria bacterium]